MQKTNGCTFSFCNSYTLEFLAEKKNRWTQKVHLAVTFSDIFSYFSTVLQEVLNCVK